MGLSLPPVTGVAEPVLTILSEVNYRDGGTKCYELAIYGKNRIEIYQHRNKDTFHWVYPYPGIENMCQITNEVFLSWLDEALLNHFKNK